MKKLIYFKDSILIKSFCGKSGQYVDRKYFATHPNEFRNCIGVCYGTVNFNSLMICKNNNIDYIHIDNCYFGTLNSFHTSTKSQKVFYRITFNATILNNIIPRPDNRLLEQLYLLKSKFGVKNFIQDYKTTGRNVLIIPPSGKILRICHINQQEWVDQVVEQVKLQTDLTPLVRYRVSSRYERFVKNPIQKDLQSAFATVSFNSCSAVDSLLFGVPSFIHDTSQTETVFKSPALPVSRDNIKKLHKRKFPTNRYQWLSHLAYGQFSRKEIGSGFAREFILKQNL